MADETKDKEAGAASEKGDTTSTPQSTVPAQAPQKDIEEATIVEETIVAPAKKGRVPEPKVAPEVTPAPPAVQVVPEPPIARPPPPPAPPIAEKSLQQKPAPPAPPPPLPEKMLEDQPRVPIAPPDFVSSSALKGPEIAPLPPRSDELAQKENEVIAKALGEIKLPERRTPPDAAKPAIATNPVTDLDRENMSRPMTEVTPQPTQRSEDTSIITPLRTLKNDLQDIVKNKKISLVRAVALESEKKHSSEQVAEREHMSSRGSRRVLGILFTAGLFVVLGVAAFAGVSIVMQGGTGTPVQSAGTSILFAESAVSFPLVERAPLEAKRMLALGRNTTGTLGSITRIVPTYTSVAEDGTEFQEAASLPFFWGALGLRAPQELQRALSDEFFFGIHTVDENAPLFVIPVLSYERAFAGMLEWEDELASDLAPVFTPVAEQKIGANGLPEKRRFEDLIMRNYDVRALRDDSNEIQLFYSFPTREYLIIAESAYSFTEILNRLRAERKL